MYIIVYACVKVLTLTAVVSPVNSSVELIDGLFPPAAKLELAFAPAPDALAGPLAMLRLGAVAHAVPLVVCVIAETLTFADPAAIMLLEGADEPELAIIDIGTARVGAFVHAVPLYSSVLLYSGLGLAPHTITPSV